MNVWYLQVGQLREVSNKSNNAELKLFLEVELGPVMLPSKFVSYFPYVVLGIFSLCGSWTSHLISMAVFTGGSIEHIQDLLPSSPPEKTKEEILLFFKFYDPLKEELWYVPFVFLPSKLKLHLIT